ncbi:hypothetical protein GCM10027341_29110 [Spirosoma knui]
MNFHQALTAQKRQDFLNANAGISLPVAGAIYWTLLGIAGYYLKPGAWVLLAFCTSGLLFPLGLALQKPFKSNLLLKTPLTSLIPFALIAMMLSWAITIPAASIDKSLVPLCLAVGMSIHWPIIGWLYDSRACQLHVAARTILTVGCWYLFPDERFIVLPLLVALVYGVTVLALKQELIQAKRQAIPTVSALNT